MLQCFKFYYESFSYPSPTSNLLPILTPRDLCSSIRVTYWEKGNNQTNQGLLETNSESTRIPRDPHPSKHYGPAIKATAWGGQMIHGVLAKSDSLWVLWVLKLQPLVISLVPECTTGQNPHVGSLTAGSRRKTEAIRAASNKENSEPQTVFPLQRN